MELLRIVGVTSAFGNPVTDLRNGLPPDQQSLCTTRYVNLLHVRVEEPFEVYHASEWGADSWLPVCVCPSGTTRTS